MKPQIALLALGLALALAAPADAKPKAGAVPSACGYKSLPLATGNTWTYKNGDKSVTVKIDNVSPGKDWSGKPATIIDVEETYAGRTIKTQWACTPTTGLSVALDSFYFTGEPGGGVGMQFTVTAHDKSWLLPEEQLTAEVAWVENMKADVARADAGGAGAVHAPAKLEVERHVQLRGGETLDIPAGHFRAQKYFFELRGRGLVEDQKNEIPIKRPGAYYITPGVGVVKIDDAFAKTWELSESNLIAK